MNAGQTPTFTVEEISLGPYAHGYGTAEDGRSFAFRVIRTSLLVEVYRDDLTTTVPAPEDVAAVAEAPVTDVDLGDERSVVALVRDALAAARPAERRTDRTTVRAFLSRISSVIDGK
ncbi:hypothetical protein [Skermania piniformis]|uniref:Uncharacterized protein n=1 Tax=Skermania pinensis TaxID=39122 RepID=A0ABX8SIN9_9ACTN|nr:hypothetical protein [Skermania piniformis]QXQ15556.1 hypothetical protein KV203_09840 [Skermania piniformis]